MVFGFAFHKRLNVGTRFSILILLTALSAGATSKKATSPKEMPKANDNLYQKAIVESEAVVPQTPSPKNGQIQAPTTAAISDVPAGILRLKDSFESKSLRTWKWLAGAHLQRFGAEGSFTNPVGTTSELGQVGKVMMPVFDLGLSSTPMSHEFYYQGLLRFGFARQTLNLQTANGSNDATLNSVLLATQAQVGYQIKSSSIGALFEGGRISYSQASLQSASSTKTNLNRSLDYLGYGFSVQQKLMDSVRGELSWIQRQNLGDSESRIQSSNFEAGASILW